MKTFSYVQIATGLFTGAYVSTNADGQQLDDFLRAKSKQGMKLIEGRFDRSRQRWDESAQSAVVDPAIEKLHLGEKKRVAAARATQAQIRALEGKQQRPVRELAVDPANKTARDKLNEIDAQIAELRKSL